MDREGSYYTSLSSRAGVLNRLGLLVGLFARKPGVAGAAILAESRASGGLPWDDIHKVREYPAQRVLTLMDSWHVVQRLYCTPENYGSVATLVRAYAAAGAEQRRQGEAQAPSGPSTVPRRAMLSLLMLAASAAVMALPFDVPGALLGAVAGCALLAVWIPGISRPAGAVAMAGAVLIAFTVFRLGTETQEFIPRSVLKGAPMPEWALYTRFGAMKATGWIRVSVGTAGLIALAGIGLAALAGKLHRRTPAETN